ncbi:hypothetical protein CDV31_013701 [Fusarium ambrosium]|uniref:Extracellular membrane protein CFEM domain-containing protein n=1 Tax=Fusarium ambrosium TaxID=131363 RepID=A0A428T1I2_9HYPO|nr:hypothetical protein CDV31_013701 [Fusarium ambrosium]
MSVKLNEWKFATENRCPEIGFDCIPPSACAKHPTTGRNYCCNADVEAICWNQGNAGEDDEATKACSTDERLEGWRCMRGSEECIRGGKINLCTLPPKVAENPLPEIGSSVLEEMYSSLSHSKPSETYLSFDPSALIAATETSSSPATSTASTIASTESTTADAASATASATNTTEPKSGLSGGAIGGIVAGVVVGVALLGLGAWFLLRKKRRERMTKVDRTGETKIDADGRIRDRQMAELDSHEVRELP